MHINNYAHMHIYFMSMKVPYSFFLAFKSEVSLSKNHYVLIHTDRKFKSTSFHLQR